MYSIDEGPITVLYLVQAAGTDLYKLGIATDLTARMRDLELMSPLKLRLIHAATFATRRLAYQVEQAGHRGLKAWGCHDHGEWFRFTRRDLDYVVTWMKKNAEANREQLEELA